MKIILISILFSFTVSATAPATNTDASMSGKACNVGIKTYKGYGVDENINHDYISVQFKNGNSQNFKSRQLQSELGSYNSLFRVNQAFSKELIDMHIFYASELQGSSYYVDYCFKKKPEINNSNDNGISFDDIDMISNAASIQDFKVKIFCGQNVNSFNEYDNSSLPLSFSRTPKKCIIRFIATESFFGDPRPWAGELEHFTPIIILN